MSHEEDPRVPEGSVCDHCKDPNNRLTHKNAQHLFQRGWDGKEITHANVHRTCAQQWAAEHGGMIINDEPLPPVR